MVWGWVFQPLANARGQITHIVLDKNYIQPKSQEILSIFSLSLSFSHPLSLSLSLSLSIYIYIERERERENKRERGSIQFKYTFFNQEYFFLIICLSVCQSVCLKIFHIFDFFSRTTLLISTKLGTKYPWMKGIQVCSNEGPHPFPRGDNTKQ